MEHIDIKALLKTVIQNGASDLHIVAGSEPQIRIDGRLVKLDLPPVSKESSEDICYSIITGEQKRKFEEEHELDFAITIEGIGRFRVNYYVTQGSIAAAFRIIPTTVPTLDDLKSPLIYKEIIKREKGLILVTGPTGSGKSTTLSAMMNEINMREKKHILTVEDPVEFVHQNKECLFSYRNVGEDTVSFSRALKAAMREDPDIILVGEMRDRETISAAITAAETGHLVFGTLHTNSAPQTINRLIDAFSGDEQPQIKAQLSVTLVAAISQVLIPKIGGGRVCCSEIMINTPAIGNLIRESKVHQIYSQMQVGQGQSGMQTQMQELEKFVRAKQITKEDALSYSVKPDELRPKIANL